MFKIFRRHRCNMKEPNAQCMFRQNTKIAYYVRTMVLISKPFPIKISLESNASGHKLKSVELSDLKTFPQIFEFSASAILESTKLLSRTSAIGKLIPRVGWLGSRDSDPVNTLEQAFIFLCLIDHLDLKLNCHLFKVGRGKEESISSSAHIFAVK